MSCKSALRLRMQILIDIKLNLGVVHTCCCTIGQEKGYKRWNGRLYLKYKTKVFACAEVNTFTCMCVCVCVYVCERVQAVAFCKCAFGCSIQWMGLCTDSGNDPSGTIYTRWPADRSHGSAGWLAAYRAGYVGRCVIDLFTEFIHQTVIAWSDPM